MEKGSEGRLPGGQYGPLWPLEPGVPSSSMGSAAQSIVGQYSGPGHPWMTVLNIFHYEECGQERDNQWATRVFICCFHLSCPLDPHRTFLVVLH